MVEFSRNILSNINKIVIEWVNEYLATTTENNMHCIVMGDQQLQLLTIRP